LFLRHATSDEIVSQASAAARTETSDDYLARAEALVDVECDETALDR